MVDTIRVAAVQMASQPLKRDENLEKAGKMVARAARRGARLVLFPELMPSGYLLNRDVWGCAEPDDGPTTSWLCEMAELHDVLVGTSFIEARGSQFHNTFVLAEPGRGIVGSVRKSTPASVEGFFFKGATDDRVMETEIGRIGVAICFENMLSSVIGQLHAGKSTLILQPHCTPTPDVAPGFDQGAVDAFIEMIRTEGPAVARLLGTPTVMANHCGPCVTTVPLFPDMDTSFTGLSAISDGTGEVLEQLDEREGIVVQDVHLDPELRSTEPPMMRGYWSRALPSFVIAWRVSRIFGAIHYTLNPSRTRAATSVPEGGDS